MPPVYVNGSLVSEEAARVSVFDHGFVTGDAVFETILVHHRRTFALRRHLDRLERSAGLVGIEVGAAMRAEIERAVADVTTASGLTLGKVRVTLSSGPGPLASARGAGPPTVVVASGPVDKPDPGAPAVASPAAVVVVPWPRNERGTLSGAKTTSYAENVVALDYARARGAQEALFVNTAGNLCEGTGSNVFVVHDGRPITPPLGSGCLAGVTRELLLEAGAAREADLSLAALGSISEGWLCSTTGGVQPISHLDGRRLPDCPGPFASAAAESYAALLAGSDEP